ncbi:MAG: sugar ABC transporter permease [Chloroflexi bacterium]|nr:sugar ABC transporter permease [Chloroflexota bacterium]MCC6894962.1 sugar ABC transporter permease [Anaerolineae bacterium]
MQSYFRNRWLPYLLLIPTLIILVCFLYYPILSTFSLSFNRSAPNGIDLTYSGLENYQRLLDPQITRTEAGVTLFKGQYLIVLVRSLVFSAIIVVGGLALSLGIAVLANQKIKGIRIYRTLLIWPYAISPAIVGVVFLFMFNPVVGVINYAWGNIFGTRPNWLGDPILTPLLVIAAAIWKNLGYNMIFYLAGLQNVGGELLEAASIDGANSWTRFWKITFPLLSPFTFFLIITNLTYSFFDVFGTIDILAGPGPANSTTVLIYNLYRDLQVNHNTGLAAAQSVMLFGLVAFLTIMQFRTNEKRVNYNA